jgi:hypothetical protein
MSTETAIVLQEFRFKEWFTTMMKPFVRYIPLLEDLSDLNTTMHWVAENPARVKEIARNGRKFYQQTDHIYGLAYRMSLLNHELELVQIKTVMDETTNL